MKIASTERDAQHAQDDMIETIEAIGVNGASKTDGTGRIGEMFTVFSDGSEAIKMTEKSTKSDMIEVTEMTRTKEFTERFTTTEIDNTETFDKLVELKIGYLNGMDTVKIAAKMENINLKNDVNTTDDIEISTPTIESTSDIKNVLDMFQSSS